MVKDSWDLDVVIELLENKRSILKLLYKDPIYYVEEISLIEEDYLWESPIIYVDDPDTIEEFLILHSPSLGGKSISAYMTVKEEVTISEFTGIMKSKGDARMYLQTSQEIVPQVRRCMEWLPETSDVRYCQAEAKTFKSHCQHKENSILLTPKNIREFWPSVSSRFVKRLETAQVYGYLNEESKLVATSGIGFLTKESFAISYTETEPKYRGRGISKCLTSLASEPLIKRGLKGVYSADVTNEPSLHVASDLGFQPYKDLGCFHWYKMRAHSNFSSH